MRRLQVWMIWRYLREGRRFLSPNILLAVTGIALGVAALMISMAVVSGYQTTLRNTLIDMEGDLMIVRRGGFEHVNHERAVLKRIKSTLPTFKASTPFLVVEGLVVHNKKLSGVMLEGVDESTMNKVIGIQKRIVRGRFDLQGERLSQNGAGTAGNAGEGSVSDGEVIPAAIIGRGIARKFDLKVGQVFNLVVPISSRDNIGSFTPKVQKFVVRGVLDLGRADFDDRYIVTDLKSAQDFGVMPGRISGWRIRLAHAREAIPAEVRLNDKLGPNYWVRSWRDPNRNLFEAVQYEKAVIFIIVLLMEIAAAFNVASTLYLIVVRRYAQISILRAMGVSKKFIRRLFSVQGLFIGVVGCALGVFVGWIGCQIFLKLESVYGLFPGKVYKLNHVVLQIRKTDMAVILIVTLVICYLATLAPARRGAKLNPVEGLRYE